MPAKKTAKTEAAETEVKTVKKAAAKKTTKKAAEPAVESTTETKAAAVKKTAKKAAAATAEEKAPAKKTAAKKTAAKKADAEKAPAKKTAAKKTATKKAEPEVEVVKKSVKEYEDIINWKKGEAHAMDWLYIEINAGDLLTEVEAGVDNLTATCNAILNCMLEGDGFIVDPAEDNKVSESLTVRYYCDNLSPERKKYFDR